MVKFENLPELNLHDYNKKLTKYTNETTKQTQGHNYSQNDVNQKEIDAISALINLGYSQLESSQVIAQVISLSDKELDVTDIIKFSLKSLVSKG